jgi:hypothetical protein
MARDRGAAALAPGRRGCARARGRSRGRSGPRRRGRRRLVGRGCRRRARTPRPLRPGSVRHTKPLRPGRRFRSRRPGRRACRLRRVERRVDVGVVDGRVFLNNVSLGLYASLVHDPRHRTKNRLIALVRMLPAALGHSRRPLDVSFAVDARRERHRALVVLVGNNDYDVRTLADLGERARLDEGRLHAYVIEAAAAGRCSRCSDALRSGVSAGRAGGPSTRRLRSGSRAAGRASTPRSTASRSSCPRASNSRRGRLRFVSSSLAGTARPREGESAELGRDWGKLHA